jgi:ornithine carbamoyltransferase
VQHLLTLADFDSDTVARLFADAARMKLARQAGETFNVSRFGGRTLGLLFEKPSLRTRVSFETAMSHLGGSTIFLGTDAGWGERESIEDFARTLTRYVCAVVYRGNHTTLEQFANSASCPVINGLTPLAHPCQALADLFTIREHFPELQKLKLSFFGDSNNVARSLAWGCAMTGAELTVASPGNYEFEASFLGSIHDRYPQARIANTCDPRAAVHDADIVYTDVWASMGDEASRESRKVAFQPYQVNAELMSAAKPTAKFMHCLPARRGEEVTDEIIDGVQSVVFDQAENRMHMQKAILAYLLNQSVQS